eukprot:scpid23053/ scgid1686/ 
MLFKNLKCVLLLKYLGMHLTTYMNMYAAICTILLKVSHRCFVCQWVLVDVHSFWARCHSDDHGHRRRVGGRLVVASRCCWEGGHCWTGDAAVCGQQDAAAASVVHGAFH